MFEILDYSEKAIAVIGDTKALKEQLKALGGRFNPRLTCGAGWVFPKGKRDAVAALLDGNRGIASTKTIAANDDIKMSEELKDEIMLSYSKLYGEHNSYWAKQLSNAVKLSDGKIVVMERPQIQTRFCFGESGYDYDEAYDMAYRVAKTEDFFLSENLESYDKILQMLERTAEPLPNSYGCDEMEARACLHHLSSCHSCEENLYKITSMWSGWGDKWEMLDRMFKGEDNDFFVLTGEDLGLVERLVKTERARFEKRLRAYLKRYGTSKLHTWTYWMDA